MSYVHPKGHKQIMEMYGLFMVIWSVLEVVIEIAIIKQLGTGMVQGSIVTTGLGFKSRASILRSLLALDKKRHAQAISLINTVTQEAKRNTLVHGHIFVGDNKITFVKRTVDQELKSSVTTFTLPELTALVSLISNKVVKLQAMLDVPDADLTSFANIGRNLATKSATLHKPPNSTKTS